MYMYVCVYIYICVCVCVCIYVFFVLLLVAAFFHCCFPWFLSIMFVVVFLLVCFRFVPLFISSLSVVFCSYLLCFFLVVLSLLLLSFSCYHLLILCCLCVPVCLPSLLFLTIWLGNIVDVSSQSTFIERGCHDSLLTKCLTFWQCLLLLKSIWTSAQPVSFELSEGEAMLNIWRHFPVHMWDKFPVPRNWSFLAKIRCTSK